MSRRELAAADCEQGWIWQVPQLTHLTRRHTYDQLHDKAIILHDVWGDVPFFERTDARKRRTSPGGFESSGLTLPCNCPWATGADADSCSAFCSVVAVDCTCALALRPNRTASRSTLVWVWLPCPYQECGTNTSFELAVRARWPSHLQNWHIRLAVLLSARCMCNQNLN